MHHISETVEYLSKLHTGYWSERILSQILYASKISDLKQHCFNDVLHKAVDYLIYQSRKETAITKQTVLTTENILTDISEYAKQNTLCCTAHAHIDMNWMWDYSETVAITLDTFRTVLNLMNEYPDFVFSQSQAAIYKIVEEFEPAMLDEIRHYVHTGRWEITASTWVEADKNMPCAESHVRQLLYTRRYLADLFQIDGASLDLDFEPDTFGHSLNVPEILYQGGIKYYFHCRGSDELGVYRWQSPSGNSVLAYRSIAYGAAIKPSIVMHVPEFCYKHGVDTALQVYGVGNHGGGPTRRDIECIIDMDSWPIFPRLRFGKYHDFFHKLEHPTKELPIVRNELNCIFTGCYASQSKIKRANKAAESHLYNAETMSALSSFQYGTEYRSEILAEAWKKTMFNHFHDILPGSGIVETKEYSLGEYQKVMAIANTETRHAMHEITSRINTSILRRNTDDLNNTCYDSNLISEGAGVGYGIKDYALPQVERGNGKRRIYHAFNTFPYKRQEIVELTVWDWPGQIERIIVTNSEGETLSHSIHTKNGIPKGQISYWGHKYFVLHVYLEIPACGYTTCILDEMPYCHQKVKQVKNLMVVKEESIQSIIMENEHIRALFDGNNASLLSLFDKKNNREMLDKSRSAGIFRYITEENTNDRSAWFVGRYVNIENLNSNIVIEEYNQDPDSIKQYLIYKISFHSSALRVHISLDKNSQFLNFNITCNWVEIADNNKLIPQLNFYLPLSYACTKSLFDIPFGIIERSAMAMDMPACNWILGLPEASDVQNACMLVSKGSYGFRSYDNSLSLTLLRSSCYPDPYPEIGVHHIQFALGIVNFQNRIIPMFHAFKLCNPISVASGTYHDGTLPLSNTFFQILEGHALVSAIKIQEGDLSGKRMIIRLYEVENKESDILLKFTVPIIHASYVDFHEKAITREPSPELITPFSVKIKIKASGIANLLFVTGD